MTVLKGAPNPRLQDHRLKPLSQWHSDNCLDPFLLISDLVSYACTWCTASWASLRQAPWPYSNLDEKRLLGSLTMWPVWRRPWHCMQPEDQDPITQILCFMSLYSLHKTVHDPSMLSRSLDHPQICLNSRQQRQTEFWISPLEEEFSLHHSNLIFKSDSSGHAEDPS